MARFVIVQGMPGSGKTTIARYLAENLNIGCISKDDIKELMGDNLGIPSNAADNAAYGMAASSAHFAIMNGIASIDKPFVVESAYWADIATPRFAALDAEGVSLLQVHVWCDYDERQQRFARRIAEGGRHTVHADGLYAGDKDTEELKHRYRPIEIEGIETILFDSTSATESDRKALLGKVKKWTYAKGKKE